MQPIDDSPVSGRLRIVLVGTGTGVGKTHVACALLAAWSARADVVGLKPIETGVPSAAAIEIAETKGMPVTAQRSSPSRARVPPSHESGSQRGSVSVSARVEGGGPGKGRRRERRGDEVSDQERLAVAAQMFHVKRRSQHARATDVDGRRGTTPQPTCSLYAFPEPISPHLAARDAGTRIDLGLIERWVSSHEGAVTVIETAGGLFSPLGHGVTNFELMQALRPHAALLVGPDRLGILHEVTTTLALASNRGGPALGVVLSAPAKRDASTGRNADELVALGIARPITVFPRAALAAKETLEAACCLIGWIDRGARRGGGSG